IRALVRRDRGAPPGHRSRSPPGRRVRAQLVHEAGTHEPARGGSGLLRPWRATDGDDALGHVRTLGRAAAGPVGAYGRHVGGRRPAPRGPVGPRGRRDAHDVSMPEPLADALAEIRGALLDPSGLRRAVAAGRRRGTAPEWVRAELRPVALK